MDKKKEAMVLASFLGDSLALGAHWIYDTKEIAKRFGRVDRLLAPDPKSYHPTKEEGAFTHYGDQTLTLLHSLVAMRGFDLQDFSTRWQALFKDYTGYVDQATRVTLSRYAAGKGPTESGSSSDDLAGAARIAPLAFVYGERLEALVPAVRSQTAMTHNTPLVLEAAAFFSLVASRCLQGESPVAAMPAVAGQRFHGSPIQEWVEEGMASRFEESVPAIVRLGQSCHIHHAFPAVVHLISRFEQDLKEALIQSVMGGGDSAARNMLVGMVLGAYHGREALPEEWLSGMKKRDEIIGLLRELSSIDSQ
jgi:ADP-ribosylglycohydrolase